jgi:flagellar hook-length control protein FliK
MNTIMPVLQASVPSDSTPPTGAGSIANSPTTNSPKDFASLLTTGAKNATRKAASTRASGGGADAATQGLGLPVPGNLPPPLPPGLAAQAAALLAAAGAGVQSAAQAGAQTGAAAAASTAAAAALQNAGHATSAGVAATAAADTAGTVAGAAPDSAALPQAEAAANAAHAAATGAAAPAASPEHVDASAAAANAAATRATNAADVAVRGRAAAAATDASRAAGSAAAGEMANAQSAASAARDGAAPVATAQSAAAVVANAQAGNGPDATALALSAAAAQAGADRAAVASQARSADRAGAQTAPSDAAGGGAQGLEESAVDRPAAAGSASTVLAGLAAQMTAGSNALERHGRSGSLESPATAPSQTDVAAANAMPLPQADPELAPAAAAAPENLTRIDAGINTPEFSQAIADHVSYLAANNLNGATLQVTPPQLGPIELRVSVEGNHAQVWLSAHNPATLDALQASSSKLRDMLGTQGFSQVNVDVSQRSFQDRSAYQQSAPWTPPEERNGRPAAHVSAATASLARARASRAGPGALDAYA